MKKVKLLKDVEMKGETFKAGMVLNCDENTANALINDGNAEEVKEADPAAASDPADAEAIIKVAVDSALAEFNKTQEEFLKRLRYRLSLVLSSPSIFLRSVISIMYSIMLVTFPLVSNTG